VIGSLDDFLIVVLVALLLFAGDKNASSIKNLFKAYNEYKRRRNELTAELRRELNEIANESTSPVREVSNQFKSGINELNTYTRTSYEDMRMKLLEERIRQLEDELRKLKESKNGSDGK